MADVPALGGRSEVIVCLVSDPVLTRGAVARNLRETLRTKENVCAC